MLPRPADTDSMGTSVPARALFGPPPETAVAEKRSSLVDFLKQVTLFEDLSRWDLRRLARIVHERDYHDGEYIFQEGKPGATLFVLRRGLVEVVRRGSTPRRGHEYLCPWKCTVLPDASLQAASARCTVRHGFRQRAFPRAGADF